MIIGSANDVFDFVLVRLDVCLKWNCQTHSATNSNGGGREERALHELSVESLSSLFLLKFWFDGDGDCDDFGCDDADDDVGVREEEEIIMKPSSLFRMLFLLLSLDILPPSLLSSFDEDE